MSRAPLVPARGDQHLVPILLATAALLGLLALASDPGLVGHFHFRRPLSSEALEETRRSRTLFALGAVLLGLAGWRLHRRPAALPRSAVRLLLAALSLGVPLFVLERAARPFVERLTTLFQADPELGWTNRPGAADTYWGEPARLNAQGMRGPERARPKPAGTQRILVLGDSVAFGLLLARDEETFAARLEAALDARCDPEVECLNAGVCGWSTRQERLFLAREGERWQPDLVLLLFVLNDVTERTAARGAAQFAYTRPDGMPAWLAESGIHLALRELALRRALAGDSPAARAHQERLTPYHLMLQPGAERVRAAWSALWPELAGLNGWCRARSIPFAVVLFPFALQLSEPGSNAPQLELAEFLEREAIPFLDLLAPFAASASRGDGAPLFLDGLHPSARGSELAAGETARFVEAHGLLP